MRTSFYRTHDITKFENKNVIYIAYIGRFDNKHHYKYGKSFNIFNREYKQHRKTFPVFEMQKIKITDNKDYIETLFEKELKIRNLYTTLKFNKKIQKELFYVDDTYSFDYVTRLLDRLVRNNPSYEVNKLRQKLDKLSKI